jgi:hypothetical protein
MIRDIGCPCCETTLRISEENLQRLGEWIIAVYGTATNVSVDISLMPAVDWTAEVTDDVIAEAVRAAVSRAATRRSRRTPRRRRP